MSDLGRLGSVDVEGYMVAVQSRNVLAAGRSAGNPSLMAVEDIGGVEAAAVVVVAVVATSREVPVASRGQELSVVGRGAVVSTSLEWRSL